MAASSRRQAIVSFALERLGGIQVADGYATDAGSLVFAGAVPVLGPDDPAVALAVVLGTDETAWQGEHVELRLPIRISALAKGVSVDAWLAVEAVVGDIKRALETADRTWGKLVMWQILRGSTETFPQEPGSGQVGATVTYTAHYKERWGHPEL